MTFRPISSTVACVLFVMLSCTTYAADITGHVALTSDFVRQGVTQSDGDAAIQIGGDVGFSNGFFFGAWGSTVDISNGPSRQRDLEVDYYAGYSFDVGQKWLFTIHSVLYTYPGQTGNVDYGYQEFSLGGGYDDRIWLEYSYTPDLYHSNRSAQDIELYIEWPINSRWSIGAGAGHHDTSNLTGRSATYWQLGVTRAFDWVDVDVRYHDIDTAVPRVSSPDRAKARVAITVQVPFQF